MPDISFQRPPVVETVLGVEFTALQQWDLRHVGLLWKEFEAEYPRFAVKPALVAQPESQDLASALATGIVIDVGFPPRYRCWLIDESDTRLVQIQDDRFIHNWRKAGDATYPRYGENVRPTFVKGWNRFLRFLPENGVEEPRLRRWEVTYVNHLEIGREWNSVADLPDILPMWTALPSGPDPLRLAGAGLQLVFLSGDQGKRRLSVSLQRATRAGDNREVLQLNLTATGPVSGPTTEHLLSDFDLGHDWVIRTFAELTSERMHELWGRVS